jgi:hypothetical protein
MSEKKTIRVVKKNERMRKEKAVPKTNSRRDTAREMVHTVTNWVNELKQKRHTETAHAIQTLFSETPQPSEV